MQSKLLVLLAACVALTAVETSGTPLDSLLNRCSGDGVERGACLRDLLRDALERDRPKFSTGVPVGNKTVVLEPLQLYKPDGTRQSRSSKMKVTEAKLTGMSEMQLESVLWTNDKAAAVVEFPALTAEARGKASYGFLPLFPKLKLRLARPRVLVGARWVAPDGQLHLMDPHVKLWMDGYNVTIDGLTSMGRTVAKTLNENSESIIEFLTPSLEAAVVRALNKVDQEEQNAALQWLENAIH